MGQWWWMEYVLWTNLVIWWWTEKYTPKVELKTMHIILTNRIDKCLDCVMQYAIDTYITRYSKYWKCTWLLSHNHTMHNVTALANMMHDAALREWHSVNQMNYFTDCWFPDAPWNVSRCALKGIVEWVIGVVIPFPRTSARFLGRCLCMWKPLAKCFRISQLCIYAGRVAVHTIGVICTDVFMRLVTVVVCESDFLATICHELAFGLHGLDQSLHRSRDAEQAQTSMCMCMIACVSTTNNNNDNNDNDNDNDNDNNNVVVLVLVPDAPSCVTRVFNCVIRPEPRLKSCSAGGFSWASRIRSRAGLLSLIACTCCNDDCNISIWLCSSCC